MGNVLLRFNFSRPRRLIELSSATQMASRTLAENSRRTPEIAPRHGRSTAGMGSFFPSLKPQVSSGKGDDLGYLYA
jgi:hypothetical protein